jgi:chromate transporter
MSPLLYMWLFLKASLLSTGGSGNLPFLHKDLIALGWAKEPDFVTAMAVGQVSPGPTGLWSISLGYLTYGWLGAFMALVALSLPPLLVLVVDAFYNRLQNLVTVQNAMRGLTLGIIGLTLTVTLGLARTTISDWGGIAIAAGAMGLALSKRVPIILVLALAALAGWLLYGR